MKIKGYRVDVNKDDQVYINIKRGKRNLILKHL